jgi:nicotinamidase-related amidase
MAVWDKFLTERDREHTERFWAKPEPFGLGSRPVLLVIDNMYGILGPRTDLLEAAATAPLSCGLEGWDAINKTTELLAAARQHDIPVVYGTLRPDLVARPVPGGRTRVEQPRHFEIVDEIRPRDGDLVITKTNASMFAGTELMFYLLEKGADTVICCGNSTSGCVRATVVDAHTNRLRVGLVEDCTFDRTEASHAMNLFDMHQKYADLLTLEAAQDYFASPVWGRAPAEVGARPSG